MATLKALHKARLALMERSDWHDDAKARQAVGRLNDSITEANAARRADIATRGALAVTTPWWVGEWQEGERYEYEPRIPIYDDMGEEIFNIEAHESPTDVASVQSIALANDIVTAVNMHDRLVKTCETARHLCRVANGRAYCKTCASLPECEIANLLKEAKATQS